MRFGKMLCLCLLVFPFFSHSLTWKEYLKSNMDNSFSVLEKRMNECKVNRQPLQKITASWFMKLTKDEKYAAAKYLAFLADKHCWGKALNNYQSDLFAYSSETHDKKALDEWLRFSKIYRGQEFENAFKHLDISSLMSWYKKKGMIQPFHLVTFLEQYKEFHKDG